MCVWVKRFGVKDYSSVASSAHDLCVMHDAGVWWQSATVLFCNSSCHLWVVMKGLCSVVGVCYLTSVLLKASHLHLEWMPYCQQWSVPCRQIPHSLSAFHLSVHRLKQSRWGIRHTNLASQSLPAQVLVCRMEWKDKMSASWNCRGIVFFNELKINTRLLNILFLNFVATLMLLLIRLMSKSMWGFCCRHIINDASKTIINPFTERNAQSIYSSSTWTSGKHTISNRLSFTSHGFHN